MNNAFDRFLNGFKRTTPIPVTTVCIHETMQILGHDWMKNDRADFDRERTLKNSKGKRCRIRIEIEIL